jgi:ubiquinone/menaquinone biosynthesis C-methylase UbiE
MENQKDENQKDENRKDVNKKNNKKNIEGIKIYFSKKTAREIAGREQNERNFEVAGIIDKILIQETKNFSGPLRAAELGGGAHPDRYHKFFGRLLEEPLSKIDWVDVSPYMLELAGEYLAKGGYQERKKTINYVQSDILQYLEGLNDGTLDIAIMKYTLDFIKDIEKMFGLLSKKLKRGGKLVATLGYQAMDGKLKSRSTNVQYFYQGKEIPGGSEIQLADGDEYAVKYFSGSADTDSPYVDDSQTLKYYYSPETLKRLAGKHGFHSFVGDWKELVKPPSGGEGPKQAVLVLTKS